MKPSLKSLNRFAYLLTRILLGSVFVVSGAIKIADVKGFARMISQYGLVPDPLLAPAAVVIPVVELLAGICLIFEIPGALTAIFSMLIVFIGVLWYGVLKDLDVDCGCFSTEEVRGQGNLRLALYRDVVMAAGCLYLYGCRVVRLWSILPSRFNSAVRKIL